ncbi:MAG: crotonobetainyl-CoA--carnitine CoA-transferase [Kiritimatiellia bacterium]|nr:crotonobetainyl-CoA--carnitine CoA-transferase [Kiritimatiellia bacterium]
MKKSNSYSMVRYGNKAETSRRGKLVDLLKRCPIPDDELLMNLGLFLPPHTLSRILFMDFLYRQALTVQGVVFDLGCRWGQNASLFSALRGIYEPYNRLRKVVAFDTFAGHVRMSARDGRNIKKGSYSVPPNYENYLKQILDLQEQESPLEHIRKYEIVKGDASQTVRNYLARNKETIVALAYFDFDVYTPTRDCLKAIRGHLTRGSVLGFDELVEPACPGETVALKEVLGLDRYAIRRTLFNARASYLVIE